MLALILYKLYVRPLPGKILDTPISLLLFTYISNNRRLFRINYIFWKRLDNIRYKSSASLNDKICAARFSEL